MSPFQTDLSTIRAPRTPLSLLSLYHVTISKHIKRIVYAHKLTPTECAVFGRRLLYFSYGGVYYRPAPGATEDRHLFPIAFVFRNSLIASIDSFFPFDTGAVFYERCGLKWKASLSPLTDYAATNADSPERIVSCFYGTNAKYVSGAVKQRLALTGKGTTLKAVHKFLREDLSAHGVDGRQRTIECLASMEVDLVNNVSCVMFPDFVAPYIARLSKRCSHRFKAIPYPAEVRFDPAHLATHLRMTLMNEYGYEHGT